MGPFSPLGELITADPTVAQLLQGKRLRFQHVQSRFAGDLQQALLRWVYKGPGIDFGFYAASVLDQQGVVVFESLPDLSRVDLDVPLDHRRYWMVGHSGAWAISSFLIKWEVSADINKSLNVGSPPLFGVVEEQIIHTMVGVTYTGVRDLTLALEFWKPWLVHQHDDLLFDANAPFIAFRGSYKLLRETLTISLAATMVGWKANMGLLIRGEVSYMIRDGLQISGGYITYRPGDDFGPFYGLGDHDRFFARLRWDFQML
jgi:hypothetical protein